VPVLTTYPVVALALSKNPLAKQTARTTILLSSASTADDMSTVFVNEVSAISAITSAGDYWMDLEAGVIFVYSADATSLPSAVSGAAGALTLRYFHYEDVTAVFSRFACVYGTNLQPGQLLVPGVSSNMCEWAGTELSDQVCGQVLAIVDDYDEALAKVRTAYSPAIGTDASGSLSNGLLNTTSIGLGQMDQMPGSATGGYSDLTAYAGAVKYAIVNLIGR
jgi:hypothetical protein